MADTGVISEEQKSLWERMLKTADGDYRRRRLVLSVIEFYQRPMEELDHKYFSKHKTNL